MIRKLLISLIALFFWQVTAVYGQVNVYHVNDFSGQSTGNGAFYVLPRTVLKVDVLVRADEQLKGPYSEYAAKLLGLEDVNNFDFTSYNITNVELTTFSEPDPSQLYFVEMPDVDSKALRTLALQLDNSGFLLSANDLNLSGSEASSGSHELIKFDHPGKSSSTEFLVSGNVTTKIDTIIRRVTVDTVMVEQVFYRTRLEDKSTEEMARIALKKIQQIRDSKYNLLTGFQETAYEAGTIEFMYDNLTKLENEYLDLFRGKSFSEYLHYTYYYVPESRTMKNPVELFKFSTGSGVTQSGSGESVHLLLTANGMEQGTEAFPETTKSTGMAYRVPGYAVAGLSFEGKEIFEGRIVVNQLGVIKRLAPQKFNVEFNPETGGLKSIFLEAGER